MVTSEELIAKIREADPAGKLPVAMVIEDDYTGAITEAEGIAVNVEKTPGQRGGLRGQVTGLPAPRLELFANVA